MILHAKLAGKPAYLAGQGLHAVQHDLDHVAKAAAPQLLPRAVGVAAELQRCVVDGHQGGGSMAAQHQGGQAGGLVEESRDTRRLEQSAKAVAVLRLARHAGKEAGCQAGTASAAACLARREVTPAEPSSQLLPALPAGLGPFCAAPAPLLPPDASSALLFAANGGVCPELALALVVASSSWPSTSSAGGQASSIAYSLRALGRCCGSRCRAGQRGRGHKGAG